MFFEGNTNKSGKQGTIEVICGCMFSGKTEELILRLNQAQEAGQRVGAFKPKIENRYHTENIVSHNATSIKSTPIESSKELLTFSENVDVIGVDEAQFFDNELAQVCEALANKGIRVILAGLDVDFKRKPFGPMPELFAIAEYITKLLAVCNDCGGQATNSFRIVANKDTVMLGAKDVYKPLCRSCYNAQLTVDNG